MPAEEIFGYRNKLEYSFTSTADGPALGFHRAGRWDEVLDIRRCWLTSDVGNAIRDAVREWAREELLDAYDQKEHRGFLRHLVVREGRNTKQVLVQLVTAPGRFDTGAFVDALRRFPEVRSIHHAVNDRPAEVTNLPTDLLWGEEAIEEQLLGLTFRVRPNAFLQTNTRMAERLVRARHRVRGPDRRRDRLRPLLRDRHDRALHGARRADGVGRRGLRGGGRVRIRERRPERDRQRGASSPARWAHRWRSCTTARATPTWPSSTRPAQACPARPCAGLARLQPRRIVYVSCNPTTLAANVKELTGEWGYRLVRARPVDMFPHTPHVETVALLERDG